MSSTAVELLWTRRDDPRYLYAGSVVRSQESRLLPRKTFESMARAESPADALEELGETDYARFMPPDPSPARLEPILEQALVDTYRLFAELVVDDDLERAFLQFHDFHNLKALIESKLAGVAPRGIVSYGMIDIDRLAAAVRAEKFTDLPEPLAVTAIEALGEWQRYANPRRLEIVIDRAALACRIEPLLRVDGSVIPTWAAALADTANLRLAVRIGRSGADPDLLDAAFTPGGEIPAAMFEPCRGKGPAAVAENLASTRYGKALRDGVAHLVERDSYAVFDRELENIPMKILRGARYEVFGPGPLIAHTAAREHEVRVVRAILVGKINGISPERIVNRLSLLYV